ncbi:hypothetical protein J6590_104115 [Homalodisca vitripennis]|nr:hypothetical protein J6590_104115 [Homalodisca vitripennis]
MIHQALIFGEPFYLCEKLVQRQEVSQRSSRQDNQLHLPRVRLEVGIKTNKPLISAPARLLLASPDLAEMCPDVSRVWCLLMSVKP